MQNEEGEGERRGEGRKGEGEGKGKEDEEERLPFIPNSVPPLKIKASPDSKGNANFDFISFPFTQKLAVHPRENSTTHPVTLSQCPISFPVYKK